VSSVQMFYALCGNYIAENYEVVVNDTLLINHD
jgi:hypothetical protein